MNLLKNKKPRTFHHEYMFSDDRKPFISEDDSHEEIHGAFVRSTKFLRRRKEKELSGRHPLGIGVSILLIIILFIIWHFISTGVWLF